LTEFPIIQISEDEGMLIIS